MAAIAVIYARPGDSRSARAIIHTLSDEAWMKEHATSSVVKALVKTGRLDDALEISETLRRNNGPLAIIIREMVRAGRERDALEASHRLSEPYSPEYGLKEIALARVRTERIQEAEAIAAQIQKPGYRREIESAITPASPEEEFALEDFLPGRRWGQAIQQAIASGRVRECGTWIRLLSDSQTYLPSFAVLCLQNGYLAEATGAARDVAHPGRRTALQRQIAQAWFEAGRQTDALDVFEEAYRSAQANQNVYMRCAALAPLFRLGRSWMRHPSTHPLMEFAGDLKDEPLFDSWVAEMRAYRAEVEADPDYR